MTSGNPITRSARRNLLLAEIRESFAMALGSIAAHKLRSGLTLLGVLVGVFSIVLVMTVLRVLQSNIESKLNVLGANSFSIQRTPAIQVEGRPGHRRAMPAEGIRVSDGQGDRGPRDAGQERGDHLWAFTRGGDLPLGQNQPRISLMGVTLGSFQTLNWSIADGRAINETDSLNARDVCVIGASIAKKAVSARRGAGREDQGGRRRLHA
jgi:putative ABC transport system permease protein